MGNRLSKIVTKTGDDGSTGLGDGSRRPKHDARLQAIGSVDELNSQLGVLLSQHCPEPLNEWLLLCQHRLFDLGGELSMPGESFFLAAAIDELEQQLSEMNETLSPLKEFILPGGHPLAAQAHVARAVARRAERDVVALSETEMVSTAILQYLNRLSDFLFIAARWLNAQFMQTDVLWQQQK